MSFPRYPEYKDNGVEWLGTVPSHWDVLSLLRVTVDRCDGPFGSGLKSEHYTDSGVRVIRLQNIRDGRFSGVSRIARVAAPHCRILHQSRLVKSRTVR